MHQQTDLNNIISCAVNALGFEVWGVEQAPSSNAVRIYIDSQNGVTITDCKQVSKQINSALHAEDLHEKYKLEVSSPGVDRIIFYKHQYSQFIGCVLKIKLLNPDNGHSHLKGELQAVHADSIEITTEQGCFKLNFDNILKAQLIYQF
jgi:ribosome maturation factor RimP